MNITAGTNITATTTQQSILAQVETAKTDLWLFVRNITTGSEQSLMRGEELVKKAQRVRDAEALAHVQLAYLQTCRLAPEERINFLIRTLSREPEDTWSGRGNDSVRSANDAVRTWAASQVDDVRYEK
jgi:hypothetical protein